MELTSQDRFELQVEAFFRITGRGYVLCGIQNGAGNIRIGDYLLVEGTDFKVRIKGFELIRFVKQEGVRRMGILVDLQGLKPSFLEGKKLVGT